MLWRFLPDQKMCLRPRVLKDANFLVAAQKRGQTILTTKITVLAIIAGPKNVPQAKDFEGCQLFSGRPKTRSKNLDANA